MARIKSLGFELNSHTADVELDTGSGTGSALVSTLAASGAYSNRITTAAANRNNVYTYRSAATQESMFYRFRIRVVSAPSADVPIVVMRGLSTADRVGIRLTTGLTLQLFNEEDAAQVGSDSSALVLNTWYLVEFSVDTTTLATTAVEARLNTSSFASGSVNLASAGMRLVWGATAGSVTVDYYIDDIAINSSSGSFQNSWFGGGKIIHLKPNAAGDASDWTNDYTYVDEVTPDDATTLVSSNTLDQIDDHNIEPPVYLGTSDTINVVQVGCRFNGAGASANASFVLRIKASASGTVEESGAITPSNTTWVTNTSATPFNYSLTLYDLPGASTTAWTKADLAAAQIGYRLSATSTNAAQISTVWLLVDYTPATDNSTTLEALAGSVAANTSVGLQEVLTGLSWTPKAIILSTNNLTADGSATSAVMGHGMTAADGTTMSIAVSHLNGAATMDTDRYHKNDRGILIINNSAAVIFDAQVILTSDGFAINITTSDAVARIINYYIVGGSDVTNATVKQFTASTGTGTQAITGVGFQPDIIVMASAVFATAPPAGTAPGIMVYGWGTSATARASMAFNMGNGGGSSVEEKTQVTDKILHVTNGGSTFMSADLDSLDADGFTLDWSTVSTARYVWMLCLKGGNYKVGTITQPTSIGNQDSESLGFTPKGIMTLSFNEAATGSLVEEINNTIGAASSSSARWTTWVGSLDNAADAVTDQNTDTTQVTKSITPDTLAVEASSDFVSNNADTFTLNFDVVDATQRQILYWAAGNPPVVGGDAYVYPKQRMRMGMGT